MKTIYKYPLIPGTNIIKMPYEANILSIQEQNGVVCMWVLVETDYSDVDYEVSIYGTGQVVTTDKQYISTFQLEGGNLVFHAFGGEL